MSRPPRAALAAAACAGLLATGCYKNTYVTDLGMGGGAYTQKASFFLWGLVGRHTVDLSPVCPDGVGWFQNRWTFVDGLIGLLTLGLYQPVTIEVRCATGQAWLGVPDEDSGGTWLYALDEGGELTAEARADLLAHGHGGAL